MIMRCLGQYSPEWVCDEASTPEFESRSPAVWSPGPRIFLPLCSTSPHLVSHAIHGADEYSVGDGVGALNGLPGVILTLAKLLLLAGMPADRGREEKGLRTLERSDPSAFRIPLIPANERPDGSRGGVLGQEPQVSRREVKLLVVKRVVGDMHLAIDRSDIVRRGGSVVENRSGIVIKAGCAALKQACNQHQAVLAHHFAEGRGGWPWNRFGRGEECVIFALAEVLRAK